MEIIKINYPSRAQQKTTLGEMTTGEMFILEAYASSAAPSVLQIIVLCRTHAEANTAEKILNSVDRNSKGLAFVKDIRTGTIIRMSHHEYVIRLEDVELTFQYPRGV